MAAPRSGWIWQRIATCYKSYYTLTMSTFSLKLPDDMYAALAAEAKRRNITRSALVREMIDRALEYDACAAPPNLRTGWRAISWAAFAADGVIWPPTRPCSKRP